VEIFFSRRDLFLGSALAGLLGPFFVGPLVCWSRGYLKSGLNWRLALAVGIVIMMYISIRCLLDVCSDLMEWRRGLKLWSAPLENSRHHNDASNRKAGVLLTAEGILIGGGGIAFLVVLNVLTDALTGLTMLQFVGAFSTVVGCLIIVERDRFGLYPFCFIERGRTTEKPDSR
jgi:hypothetical protein